MSNAGKLERVTANLTPGTAEALKAAVELTGDSKTDVVNRAIRLYALAAQNGDGVYIRENGELVKVMMA